MIRAKVRQVAEQQRNVQDLEAYDILLHKSFQEFQEVRVRTCASEAGDVPSLAHCCDARAAL